MNLNDRSTINRKRNSAIRPFSNFNPIDDAYSIHEAIKIFDEQPLIDILCNRTNDQRQIIQHQYQKEFGRLLIVDIKSKAKGNFKRILCALLTPPLDYRVKILYKAINSPITDADALVELLCGYSNKEIETVAQVYSCKYKQSLPDNIRSSISGHFKRILLSILEGREEDRLLNYLLAQSEAALLLQGGILSNSPREDIFNTVFCRRNYNQIRITNKEYKIITGHSLNLTVENLYSGSVRDAFNAILSATDNRSDYFAEKLHKAMNGLGTNDKQLIRIMVSQSEIDLMSIKTAFEQKFRKPLKNWIKADTSGYYRDCLLALIHEQI